jgi:hypothetical protein
LIVFITEVTSPGVKRVDELLAKLANEVGLFILLTTVAVPVTVLVPTAGARLVDVLLVTTWFGSICVPITASVDTACELCCPVGIVIPAAEIAAL